MELSRANTDVEIAGCFPVLKVLRPHLEEATFVATVRRQMGRGYQLVFLRHEGAVVAATGYRVLEFLAWGRVLYVDDLVTDPAQRGKRFCGRADGLADRASADWAMCGVASGFRIPEARRASVVSEQGVELACHHSRAEVGREDGQVNWWR